jgi:DNA-binding transcriptional regulator YiaG
MRTESARGNVRGNKRPDLELHPREQDYEADQLTEEAYWRFRIDVVRNRRRAHNFTMTLIRVTGSQLHAARVLVGLSREVLAERAGLCRHSICKWETSSHAVRGAMCGHLCRVVDVLDAAMGQRTMRRAPSPNYRSGTRLHQLRVAMDLAAWVPHAGVQATRV